MKVIDRWQTQHGSWDVNPANKYGIDQAHRDKYLAGRDIPPAGADHHILVKVKPGQGVQFYSGNPAETVQIVAPASGWVDFPMSKDAGYYPANGEKGPWQVAVNMQVVADGIGMPEHEHVSTFLVIDDTIDSGPPQPPVPTLTAQQALAQVRRDLDILESLLGGN